ncbi:MAG: hypothetical protein PF549_03215 [Patescibacteria group bacterium]|jgi:uncharacterized protein HemY|nr:hypothetical protein [Patescibacteria group bacterium]
MESFEKNPAYKKEDLEVNKEEELNKAKKEAGVKSHKEVMQTALEHGLREDDQQLIEKATEEIRRIEKEMKAKEQLLDSSNLLEKLKSFLKSKEEREVQLASVGEETEKLSQLTKDLEGINVDIRQTVDVLKEKAFEEKEIREDLEKFTEKLPYNQIDIAFAQKYLNNLKESKEKLDSMEDSPEKQKLVEQIETEAEKFINEHEAKAQEMYKKAAEESESRGHFGSAGKYYREAGEETKAQEMYKKAAEEREAKENFSSAGKYYREAGEETKSQEMYKKAAEKAEAGESFISAGRYYRETGEETKAQEMYKKVAEAFEIDKLFGYAAEYYREAGEEAKAQEVCKKGAEESESRGHFGSAGKYYREAGEEAKAQEMYKKAAEKAEAGESFSSAGNFYREAGEETKAQEMYKKEAEERETKENFGSAGDLYRKAGKLINEEKINEILDGVKEL